MNELIPYEPVIRFPIMELRAPGNRVAPWDRIARGSQGFGGLSGLAAAQAQQFNQAQKAPNNLLSAIGSGIFGGLR